MKRSEGLFYDIGTQIENSGTSEKPLLGLRPSLELVKT
jgi:hypothetical protein